MPLVNESITKSPCKKLNYPCDPSKKNSDCNSPSSSPSCDLKCLKTHNFPFLPVDSPGDQYRCIKNDNPKCIDYNFQTNLIQQHECSADSPTCPCGSLCSGACCFTDSSNCLGTFYDSDPYDNFHPTPCSETMLCNRTQLRDQDCSSWVKTECKNGKCVLPS